MNLNLQPNLDRLVEDLHFLNKYAKILCKVFWLALFLPTNLYVNPIFNVLNKKLDMKKLFVFTVILLISGTAFSQVVFDLGLKAGVHTSKLNFDVIGDITDDLSSDAITKTHWGAFGRVGYNRLYVQPEIYFGKKGSKLDIDGEMGDFDYKNVDMPLLIGYSLTEGKLVNFRVLAGPVFSFMSDAKFDGDKIDEYF
jgi:hypothetical protein